MGQDGTDTIGRLEEMLAALGVDDAPVFAEYVQSMVTDAAESEEELPLAVESACEYIGELAGLEDEGDERLGRIAEELTNHWKEEREAQKAEQQTDRAMAASAASLETIQSAMRAYREEDESSSKQQQHHHNHQSSEEAEIIKAATLARANASSSAREAPPDEVLAADLGPAIDNRAGGRAVGNNAEVQKKQAERQEHIKASNEVRKAKKEAEEKKKAHRMNMSESKLKAVLKEEKGEKVKAQKQGGGRRK